MKNPRIAIVTGASRGIGAATALRLASAGYSVCVNYRENADAAKNVVDKIIAQGGNAIAAQADVRSESAIEELFDIVDAELGIPSALVNNAAIIEPQMRLESMTAQRINHTLLTNVTGAILCCREAVRRMSTSLGGAGGSIVNVSSGAARTGAPNEYIDYAASKGAIDTLTRGLAVEVAGDGIRVNCVRPGFIYTDMHASAGEPGRVDRLRSKIPLGRGGRPEEVANAIAWLLSDEASYTTGGFVDVAGGR